MTSKAPSRAKAGPSVTETQNMSLFAFGKSCSLSFSISYTVKDNREVGCAKHCKAMHSYSHCMSLIECSPGR